MLKGYASNEKKEVEGVWRDGSRGGRFLIARLGNPKYERLLRQYLRPYRRAQAAGTLDPEVLRQCVAKAMARTILLNWDGVQAEDGTNLPYSVQTAEQALLQLRDFYDEIESLSNDAAAYRDEELEGDAEALGNA